MENIISKHLAFAVEFNVKPEANDPNTFLIYESWAEPTVETFVENQLKGNRYRDEYETEKF